MLTRTFVQMAQELEHQRQQEHRLIEKLINAQEEERKLVAYDLHDGLIQQLVGARYYLNSVYEQYQDSDQAGADDIRRGCETLTEAIIEGRRIVEGLRPAVLDDLGLTVAIEEVAQVSAQAAGWTLELDVESIPVEPDKAVGVTVFRIAQEALNNIRKHADARHVRLTLRNGNGIDLLIQDDGKGFASHVLNGETRGLGVTTMKERATLIHGTCEISSMPGGGTKVHMWVPLSPHAGAPGRPDPV
jgi:signal transduction histidine kinase